MIDLEPEERALLRAAHRAFTPAPEVAARAGAALATKLGAAGHVTRGLKLGGLGAKGILGSALAVLGITTAAALAIRAPSAPSPGTASAQETSTLVRRPLPQPAAPASAWASAPVPPSTAASDAARPPEPSAPATSAQPRETPRPGPAGARAPVPSLGEELAAVRAAEAALNQGNPAGALAILNASRPAAGRSLGEERAALRLLAECATGGVSRARLERFYAAYPHSMYRVRLRGACPE